MNRYQTISRVLCGLTLLAASASSHALGMQPGVVSAPQPQRSATVLASLGSTLPTLQLAAMTPARLAAETAAANPEQIGLGRVVPKSELQGLGTANPTWQLLDDGRQLAALAVESPGALALRLGLRVRQLPETAQLRFGADPTTGIEPIAVSAAEALALVAANLNADPLDPDAEIYWSPVVTGERVILELELPKGSDPSAVEMEIAEVSHLYSGSITEKGLYEPRAVGDAGSCNNDISCYSASIIQFGSATARMVFTEDGSTFLCTGTLLNDANPSADFHFLTANHCISTQVSASSLQTYWNFRSSSCNGSIEYSGSETRTGGATLLRTLGSTYDSTLLRLNQTPPGGVGMSGWDGGSIPGSGAALVGVHHPRGDWQKISFGNRDVVAACTDIGQYYSCQSDPNGHFIAVGWNDGVTEAGSSGSGIFTDSGHILVGNLSSGGSSCSTPNELDFYASFADAYTAGNFGTWLLDDGNSTPPPTGTDIAKNLSTRGYITPTFPMHGGIVVSGNPKVLITARGPSSGLTTALSDTTMQLFALNPGQPATLLRENDDWQDNANAAEIASLTSSRPLALLEAALLGNLPSGAYTSVVRDNGNNDSGEALLGFTLVADSGGTARNLSTRGDVTPNFPMHGGIVVEGTVQVLITARGPSTGLATALNDTTMQLYKIGGGLPPELIYYNDDWWTNANSAQITSLTSSRPLTEFESALLVTLPTGAYTAVVRDYNNANSGEVVLGFTVID